MLKETVRMTRLNFNSQTQNRKFGRIGHIACRSWLAKALECDVTWDFRTFCKMMYGPQTQG